MASIILVFIVYFGTIYNIQPFKAVMDLGTYTSESWEKKEQSAPIPHTEAMTIVELSEKIVKLTPEEIKEKLNKKGISVKDNKKTLDEIGRENNISPFEVYKIITANSEVKKMNANSLKAGSGFGRKTLEDVADILKIDVKVLLERLKNIGVKANEQEKIKDIAEKSNKTPIEIIDILKGKNI
jgi:thermostable 8-oxoguanine DNA glycosylase